LLHLLFESTNSTDTKIESVGGELLPGSGFETEEPEPDYEEFEEAFEE
jgi:hypothetical protein